MRQLIEIQLSAEGQKAASSESFHVGVKNARDDEPAEIEIYGVVGDSYDACDARSVSAFLRANKGKAVNVSINSPGGLAYDGITIHNALLSHDGPVKCTIDGMAGSAASVIAMAGSPLCMYENAQLFIHRASVIAIGNRDMMVEAIDWLDKIDDSIARTYKAKTGKAFDKIMSLMKGKVDGTVFTAREAKDAGFIDEIISLKNGKPSANALSPKPENCTCGFPNQTLRNGSGHDPSCECHKEWERAGGFKQSLRAEGDQRFQHVEAARLQRIRSRRELFAPSGDSK